MKINTCLPHILVALFFSTAAVQSSLAISYSDIDVPGGINTQATGIEGGSIVGFYSDGVSYHGFLHNGSNYRILDVPLATRGTFPRGISGGRIVGSYSDSFGSHGFIYDGSEYISFDDPLAATNPTAGGENGTFPTGIDGNNIVGFYSDTFGKRHGYLYDGATFTDLNDPLGYETSPSGIDGSNIVGWYFDYGSGPHSFLYDGTTYTTLHYPSIGNENYAFGIDGSNIVGGYFASLNGGNHGFLCSGTTCMTLDDPSAKPEGTYAAMGIDGSNIVGSYYDVAGNLHGFLTSIPEPNTILLAGIAIIAGFGCLHRLHRPTCIAPSPHDAGCGGVGGLFM